MFLQTTNEVINVKVKDKLFEDYDIFEFVNNKSGENLPTVVSTLKKLEILDKVEIIHHEKEYENAGKHFVVFEKDEVALSELKNDDFKVNQVFNEIEKTTALNICLMMLTNRSNDIPNRGYYKILERQPNQRVALKLRFENKREELDKKLYLTLSIQTFTDPSYVNDDKFRPFYAELGDKMVQVTGAYDGRKYVPCNPFNVKNNYDKFVIPRGCSKYNRGEYVSASIFGTMMDIFGKQWEELDEYVSFDFKKEELERYSNHKAFDKMKDEIKNKFNLMDINFVADEKYQTELKKKLEKLFSPEDNKDEPKIKINSWVISGEITDGYNVVLLETGKAKKSDKKEKPETASKKKKKRKVVHPNQEEADKVYNETKMTSETGFIVQHLVKGNENLESMLTCLEELLIKESLLQNKLPEFMQGILPEGRCYTFFLTTQIDDGDSKKNLCHKLSIKDNYVSYVTNLEIPDDEEMEYYGKDSKTILDEDGNVIRIYETENCAMPDFNKLNDTITYASAQKEKMVPLCYFGEMLEEAFKSKELSQENKDNAVLLLQSTPDFESDEEISLNEAKEKYFKNRTDILNGKINKDGTPKKQSFTALFDFCIGTDTNLHLQAKTEDGINGLYPAFIDVSYNNDKYMVAMPDSLKENMARGILVRRYESEGENFFKELLPSFYVPFVKRNNLTVYPFPFKLLREAIEIL